MPQNHLIEIGGKVSLMAQVQEVSKPNGVWVAHLILQRARHA